MRHGIGTKGWFAALSKGLRNGYEHCHPQSLTSYGAGIVSLQAATVGFAWSLVIVRLANLIFAHGQKGESMIIKAIICIFKGHDINPDESIVGDIMKDKRNWLCKCHRCGLYEMHDGAISQSNITLTKSQAYRTKMEFERDFMNMRQWAERRTGWMT